MFSVLLVEDDLATRFVYKGMKTWTDCGFNITKEASDGGQALRILEKESFDLIFTDIRMPFVDGIELLRKLKENNNTIPVVFASSYNEFEYARQGLILGAFDYLLKPVDESKLRDVLTRVGDIITEQHQAKIDTVMSALLDRLGLSPDGDEFVKQIAVYSCEHYKDDMLSEDFADIHGFRKDYFGKIFKQHFKIPFNEFRTRVKIAYAVEMLRTGNYKAYEVSDMLGFSSYQYFNKNFKAVTGASPGDFKFGN